MRRKDETQEEKKRDKRLAEDRNDILVLTVDLQQVLLVPKLLQRFLRRIKSIRPRTVTGDPQVHDLRALRYSPDGEITYKLHHSDDWKSLPRTLARRSTGEIQNLYDQPRPIPRRKWQDLQQLKALLPDEYHCFYDSLAHE
ncbi:hypothetical protein BaRGS_00032622 [Batillaria attramentaria]|uniref:Uncharacterized protein n=1 Tax=Batillaria attramentaria TaxID=370345 RepID=A0ABD0JMQ6_9CAEN